MQSTDTATLIPLLCLLHSQIMDEPWDNKMENATSLRNRYTINMSVHLLHPTSPDSQLISMSVPLLFHVIAAG